RLAIALPSLDDGSWKVRSDGTMTTAYRLRPGVTWHDGAPLTADDVAYAFEIARGLDVPLVPAGVLAAIDGVVARDRLTVDVSWRRVLAGANAVRQALAPAPLRLLPDATNLGVSDQPYWSRGFVGLGPYRVETFVPGKRIELRGNEQFFLGKPRIEQITVL